MAEAIGTGRVYAICALQGPNYHLLDRQKDEEAVLLAYRVLANTISIAANDVGPPISMYIARRDGASALTEDQLLAIDRRMTEWQQEELEVFNHLAEKRGIQAGNEDENYADDSVGLDLPPE